MTAAERLTDFTSETRRDRQTTPNPVQNKAGGAKSFRSNSNRGGGDRKPHAQSGSQGSSSRNKPQENRQGAPHRSTGCFLCDGPHRYRDCPKKQLLNTLATITDKASPAKPVEPQASVSGGNDPEEDEDNLGAISQWCNTLSHQVATKKTIPPCVGKTAPALTRSQLEDEAKPESSEERDDRVGRVKAINSAAQPTAGVAKSVLIKVGAYEGKTNLSVVVMDDFKLILELEFLRDTRTAVLPHVDSLMMMGTKLVLSPH
ncbi:UNVERIFIED_CONTAM: hypothetical protein Slati_1120500 [Sesamum latifolium]|uniref:Gag-pol polyprotein n=1 Tax=Sesamum latifolium TaxID=2727402 RepID=A0AAW2XDY5_9LAMI